MSAIWKNDLKMTRWMKGEKWSTKEGYDSTKKHSHARVKLILIKHRAMVGSCDGQNVDNLRGTKNHM